MDHSVWDTENPPTPHEPRVTDRVVDSMLKWENELRERPGGADDAEGGEGDVPHDEERAHLVPGPRAHVPLHEHDHGEIGTWDKQGEAERYFIYLDNHLLKFS